MPGLWLLLCLVTPLPGFLRPLGVSGYDNFLDKRHGLIVVCVIFLTSLRFRLNSVRAIPVWIFWLVTDSLLALLLLGAGIGNVSSYFSAEHEGILFSLFLLLVIVLSLVQCFRVLRAMLQAPELFGRERIPHEILAREVEYRLQQHVE